MRVALVLVISCILTGCSSSKREDYMDRCVAQKTDRSIPKGQAIRECTETANIFYNEVK